MATYWEIAAHSAYDMFSWYKYLIVDLVFSHLGFWSGNLFLIAPFPDLCLLVPFNIKTLSFRRHACRKIQLTCHKQFSMYFILPFKVYSMYMCTLTSVVLSILDLITHFQRLGCLRDNINFFTITSNGV